MWESLLEPRVTRVHTAIPHLWAAVQEVIHHTVHTRPGTVLVCDGSHGFNPYEYAELNLVRDKPAAFGSERVLVKRAMTAFQWDTILDKHLAERLLQGGVSLVVAAPYDALFAHEELQDWEQEDHLRFSVADLAAKAQRFQVPILAFADTLRQSRNHPILWKIQEEGIPRKWRAWLQGGAWRLADEADPEALRNAAVQPGPAYRGTIQAYLPACPTYLPACPTYLPTCLPSEPSSPLPLSETRALLALPIPKRGAVAVRRDKPLP